MVYTAPSTCNEKNSHLQLHTYTVHVLHITCYPPSKLAAYFTLFLSRTHSARKLENIRNSTHVNFVGHRVPRPKQNGAIMTRTENKLAWSPGKEMAIKKSLKRKFQKSEEIVKKQNFEKKEIVLLKCNFK